MKNNRAVFNKIYKYNLWGFGSGTGSVWPINKDTVNYLNGFLKAHNDIKTIVDLGCGDMQIIKHVNLDNRKYIGVDVSDLIINKIKKKFNNIDGKFLILDIVKDKIPKGDLVIIKDVLMHLPNKDIIKVLQKIKNYKYIIIQNCTGELFTENRDIKPGQWRPLDVTKPPFNFSQVRIKKQFYDNFYTPIFIFFKLFRIPVIYNTIFTNH